MAEQVVTELTVDTGRAAVALDQYVRSMERAGSATDIATKKTDELSAAVRRVQNVSINSSPIDRVSKQIDAIQARVDPAFQANKRIELAASRIDRAVSLGITSREQGDDLLARYRETVERTIAPTTRLASANDNLGRSAGLARDEMVNLSRQMQDVATMAAMGAGPMQILSSQGAQIYDIFSSSQGTVKGFAGQVVSALTPARVAIAGVTIATIAGAAAWLQYDAAQREVARNLTGWGRDSGLTVRQINAIAEAQARAANTSVARARSTIAALAGTGRVDAVMLGPIQRIEKDLAATLSLDTVEANKLLAESFSDPVRGMELLNSRLGGLTEQTRLYIREQVASGNQQRAAQALLDTFTPRIGKAAELTSFWARTWESVKSGASNALDAVGRTLDRATTTQPKTEIDVLQERVRQLEASASGNVVDRTNGRDLGSRSTFGQTQEELQRRRDINSELETTRQRLDAVRLAQERVNEMVAIQGAAEATRARQNRAMEAGLQSAREIGLPDRRRLDDMTTYLDNYRRLIQRRDAAYMRQGDEGGGEIYRQARQEVLEAQRFLRSQLRDNGRDVISRDGSLLLDNNAILARRLSQQDLYARGVEVEQQSIVARTAQQQAAAAAAQSRHRDSQDRTAGDAGIVSFRAQSAAATTLLQINEQLSRAGVERIRSTQMSIDATRAETLAMGGSISQQERVRTEQQLINDAKREYARLGLTVPQAEIDRYRELAKAMGEARQEQALVRLRQDLTFESQTMFLPDSERRVAQTMRNVYGEGWSSQMDSAVAAQVRFNEQLRLTGDLFSGFGSGMLQDLRSGATLWGALGNQVARVGDRLLSMAMDNAIKQLLGGLMGGSGGMGWLGGLFGIGGSASGGAGASISTGTGGLYANGGIFGPAGLHPFALGGAFTNSIVDRPTLFPFANGTGLMGEAGPEAIMPLQRDSRGRLGVSYTPSARGQGQGGFTGKVIVNNNGQPVSASVRSDSQGNMVIDLEAMADRMEARQARNISRRNSPIGNAMAGAYGLQQRPVVG